MEAIGSMMLQADLGFLEAPQTAGQAAISTQRSESTRALLAALLELAEARQTTVGEVGLRVYLSELIQFEFRDVKAAIRLLAAKSREEFEPAFPQLGTIIGFAKAAREERTKPKPWVACGKCINGWVYVNAQGAPCGFSVTDRRVVECSCKRGWRAARDAARYEAEGLHDSR